jgi:predicted RNase H-like nuclease (RuvC/YqgF family)
MKRQFGCFIFIFFISAVPLFAQTSAEHVEKIERMSKDIETLIAANADLQRRISGLSEELNRVRQEQSRSANDTAVQALREDLRRLADNVKEVDRKRISDKEEIAKELDRTFDKIEKLLKSNSGSSGGRTTSTPTSPSKPIPSEGFEYIVKAGDNSLRGIINQANVQLKQQGLKPVTLTQVLDANPGLVAERMQIGQKIFIPAYK